jgi:hypothetical protein
MRQSKLFEKEKGSDSYDPREIVLYALGDFQARGKVLAERELPLDRLRGAFKRASEIYEVEELSDERAVESLRSLGAEVRQVPAFVAKHPYRVIVHHPLVERALRHYQEHIDASLRAS